MKTIKTILTLALLAGASSLSAERDEKMLEALIFAGYNPEAGTLTQGILAKALPILGHPLKSNF